MALVAGAGNLGGLALLPWQRLVVADFEDDLGDVFGELVGDHLPRNFLIFDGVVKQGSNDGLLVRMS